LSEHVISRSPLDNRPPLGCRAPAFGSRLLAGIAVALLAGLIYANALHNPFVYDDHVLIVENPSILSVRDVHAIVAFAVTRPLVNFSYAVDRALWGGAPFGFHVTNVLWHMLNVFLVFHIASLLAVDGRTATGWTGGVTDGSVDLAALTAAGIFAVHPMMTQAVGYISGRSELMSAACCLLAFLAARRWMRGHGEYWWGVAAVVWVLALATKEVAIMLPVMLVAYDRLMLPGNRRDRARRWSLHLPLLALMILAALVRAWVLMVIEYPQHRSDWRFALVELEVIRQYLVLLAVPHGQTIFHSTSAAARASIGQLALAAAVAAAPLTLAWWIRRVDRVAALGICWFALLLLPSSLLLVFVRGEPMAEHRVYFASIGIWLAVGSGAGWLMAAVRGRRWFTRCLVYACFAMVVLQLGVGTWRRNVVWSDPVVLWEEAVRAAPDHGLPRVHLAEELRKTGRCETAVVEYRRSIEMRPKVRFAYGGLGTCLLTLGRLDEARESFTSFRDLDDRSSDRSLGIGLVDKLREGSQDSREYVIEALARDPSSLLARQLLTVVERP
jgi:hypothetical protein